MKKTSPMAAWLIASFLGAALLFQAPPSLAAEHAEKAECKNCPHAGEKSERCGEEWKARHSEMMAKKAEMEARLDNLVATMNAAEGEAKVDALAAVVNEMIAQRTIRHAHKSKGHGWKGCCSDKCSGGSPEEEGAEAGSEAPEVQ